MQLLKIYLDLTTTSKVGGADRDRGQQTASHCDIIIVDRRLAADISRDDDILLGSIYACLANARSARSKY